MLSPPTPHYAVHCQCAMVLLSSELLRLVLSFKFSKPDACELPGEIRVRESVSLDTVSSVEPRKVFEFWRVLCLAFSLLSPPLCLKGLVGLHNIGQTCCLNSLVQVLMMNVDFRKILKRYSSDSA